MSLSPKRPQGPYGPLILASQSPRRRQLLAEAGYDFTVQVPDESAECGVCSGETPAELVARLAYQKARSVAARIERGRIVACDTVAFCQGQILGKPADREQARKMLELLSGRRHHVYSGLCLWQRPGDRRLVDVECTELVMDPLAPAQLEAYLDSEAWCGKAGAFGYQDDLDWVHVHRGSETNVVGLPMELLERMLQRMDEQLEAQG